MQDADIMAIALERAKDAIELGEVPIGAVAVLNNELVATAHNSPISSCDPTAHAEILVLREAAKNIGAYRLPGLEVFVTLEPCIMCYGALIHARVQRLVYAASDPKVGYTKTYNLAKESGTFNHEIEVVSGVLAEESARLLRDFFKQKR